MSRFFKVLVLPLVLAASGWTSATPAAEIRDRAGMFRTETVKKALADLDRVESKDGVPITVETVTSLEGNDIEDVLPEHARRAGATGLYVLIAKNESKIRVLSSSKYRQALNATRTKAIANAFVGPFKSGDFDEGLTAGVLALSEQVDAAKAQGGLAQSNRAGRPANRPGNANGSFGLGSLLWIGILVLGGMFVLRLIGRLFGMGGNRGYAPGQPRMMGAPGYGGGGGGGFMSSLFGGLGGAIAGNWMYDQFSGRHQGGNYADTNAPTNTSDDWGGGGGSTADFGGDAGGGGDWGGGGGGGGGDGGAGGDW